MNQGALPSWQPIETAPKDGTRVLCWSVQWEAPETGCRYGPIWASLGLAADKGGWKHQPTHWVPLPAPPARAALTPEDRSAWERCHIGSCKRHKDCMYMPCRAALAQPSQED